MIVKRASPRGRKGKVEFQPTARRGGNIELKGMGLVACAKAAGDLLAISFTGATVIDKRQKRELGPVVVIFIILQVD